MIYNFLMVREVEPEELLSKITLILASKKLELSNLYLSILPPIEDMYFMEFSDFVPISRYRDIDAIDFLIDFHKVFKCVYYILKNNQNKTARYQKYRNSKLEREFKGPDSLEKALKYDLIMLKDEFFNHVDKAWNLKYTAAEPKPLVVQFIKDSVFLRDPIIIEPIDFYGHIEEVVS